MAQECGFFNAQLIGEDEYDRVYLAEQFAAYFASFIGNGVFGKSMQKLEVLAQTSPDMSVKVLPGEAWINGWWYRNTEEYMLSLDVADGVLSRVDVIVLRWGNQERDMWLQVVKGVASSSPVAPNIRRDADYYDLQLATVTISRGTIKITQSSINDTRLDNAVCGLVTGVVDQIDTTDLYNQFTTYFTEFKQTYEADFDKWSVEQKEAFLTYIAYQKGLYDRYVAELQADYDTWTEDKKADFTQWVTNEEEAYDAWTEAQKQAYAGWYDIHTKLWEQQFDNWFDNIKDKLSSDIAGSLQSQIDELDSKQPKVQVADIEHNLDAYIHCDLFETTYACGVQGAGEGPAGGGPLISSPVEYEMVDKNHVKIKAIDGLGDVLSVTKLDENVYTVLFINRTKSLIAMINVINDRVKNKNESEEVVG